MIPKQIIQTHRDPEIGAGRRQSWRDHHPDFDYRFFDDDDCARFIRDFFPSLWPGYEKLPLAVQRADLFRYAAIYRLGGVYADVDTVCLAPLSSYIDFSAPSLVAGVEMTTAEWQSDPRRYLANYCVPEQWLQWLFVAPPSHPGLGAVLKQLERSLSGCSRDQLVRWSNVPRFTLELTGPVLFTRTLAALMTGGGIDLKLLHRHVWGAFPSEFRNPGVRARMKAAHLFEGSWKGSGRKPEKP